jgi:hypothetical protein
MAAKDTGTRTDGRKDDPATVLFISGSGRSGTTLLDRLLGLAPQTFSGGELRFMWERNLLENRPCGCGALFRACEHWNAVMDEAFGGMDRVPLAEIRGLQKQVDRYRCLHWLMQPVRPAAFTRALRDYSYYLAQFYRAVQTVTGRSLIVDSSKDPPQALIMASSNAFDVRVIHLVRDSRATAFSWLRRKQSRMASGRMLMQIRPVTTSARRWWYHNLASEMIRPKVDAYYRMRYEDFVASPDRELGRMASTLSVPIVPIGREVVLPVQHQTTGNPIRFDHGPTTIAADNEWTSKMSAKDFAVVTSMTAPLLLRYGYSLNRPRP